MSTSTVEGTVIVTTVSFVAELFKFSRVEDVEVNSWGAAGSADNSEWDAVSTTGRGTTGGV
jgi:hypothetical protein